MNTRLSLNLRLSLLVTLPILAKTMKNHDRTSKKQLKDVNVDMFDFDEECFVARNAVEISRLKHFD